jgi:hypothetical protein
VEITCRTPAAAVAGGSRQDAIAAEPIDPQISLRLTGPAGVRRYLLAAWHPQFMAPLDDADMGQHGAAARTIRSSGTGIRRRIHRQGRHAGRCG